MAGNTALWDVGKACQQFQSHSACIQNQPNQFEKALKSLLNVSDQFYLKALDAGYTISSSRTAQQAKKTSHVITLAPFHPIKSTRERKIYRQSSLTDTRLTKVTSKFFLY